MSKVDKMDDKATVLIVDDSTADVQEIASILKDDYHIRLAKDGARALELLKGELKPDLVLLDVHMPIMSGYEVLQDLDSCDTCEVSPIILVTGSYSVEDEERGFLLGAADFITKPVRASILKARVKTQITLKKQRDKLIYNASHDQLTGLYNYNHLLEEGERKFSRATRQNDKLSLVMIDVDNFKLINEQHGYSVGDKVIKELAVLISSYDKRNEDLSARLLGEEFVIIFEGCSGSDAKIKAEILRKKIEELNPSDIKITASLGVCEMDKAYKTFDALLKDADEALYVAKSLGRNRVVLFTDEEL